MTSWGIIGDSRGHEAQSAIAFCLSVPGIFLSTLSLNTLNLRSSLIVRDCVLQLKKGEIYISLYFNPYA